MENHIPNRLRRKNNRALYRAELSRTLKRTFGAYRLHSSNRFVPTVRQLFINGILVS